MSIIQSIIKNILIRKKKQWPNANFQNAVISISPSPHQSCLFSSSVNPLLQALVHSNHCPNVSSNNLIFSMRLFKRTHMICALYVRFLRLTQVYACISSSLYLLLSSISLYCCTTICWSINQLIDIGVVFNLGLLWIKLLQTFQYRLYAVIYFHVSRR